MTKKDIKRMICEADEALAITSETMKELRKYRRNLVTLSKRKEKRVLV